MAVNSVWIKLGLSRSLNTALPVFNRPSLIAFVACARIHLRDVAERSQRNGKVEDEIQENL